MIIGAISNAWLKMQTGSEKLLSKNEVGLSDIYENWSTDAKAINEISMQVISPVKKDKLMRELLEYLKRHLKPPEVYYMA